MLTMGPSAWWRQKHDYGQFFNSVGEKLGPEFQVNHLSVGEQFRPEAVEVDGGY